PNICVVNCPKVRFNPLALLGDQLLCLPREILNALPNPRAPLEPTGIAVSITIIARFPAGLTVGLAARLQGCPQRTSPLKPSSPSRTRDCSTNCGNAPTI